MQIPKEFSNNIMHCIQSVNMLYLFRFVFAFIKYESLEFVRPLDWGLFYLHQF